MPDLALDGRKAPPRHCRMPVLCGPPATADRNRSGVRAEIGGHYRSKPASEHSLGTLVGLRTIMPARRLFARDGYFQTKQRAILLAAEDVTVARAAAGKRSADGELDGAGGIERHPVGDPIWCDAEQATNCFVR
jgi:hypothetical protein